MIRCAIEIEPVEIVQMGVLARTLGDDGSQLLADDGQGELAGFYLPGARRWR